MVNRHSSVNPDNLIIRRRGELCSPACGAKLNLSLPLGEGGALAPDEVLVFGFR